MGVITKMAKKAIVSIKSEYILKKGIIMRKYEDLNPIHENVLGVTVSFTIPVAMNVLSKEDKSYAAKGILCGITTIYEGME